MVVTLFTSCSSRDDVVVVYISYGIWIQNITQTMIKVADKVVKERRKREGPTHLF